MTYNIKFLFHSTQTHMHDTHSSQWTHFGPFVACHMALGEQHIHSDCLSCLCSGWWHSFCMWTVQHAQINISRTSRLRTEVGGAHVGIRHQLIQLLRWDGLKQQVSGLLFWWGIKNMLKTDLRLVSVNNIRATSCIVLWVLRANIYFKISG